MARWVFFALFLVAASAAAWYAYLGGFNKAVVGEETTARPLFLAGQPFHGPANSDDFGPLFRQVQQLRESGRLRGELANIYYNDPEAANDSVRAFVGLLVPDTTSQRLPAGYRYLVFPAGQRVVRATLNASFLVAPGRLYSSIRNFIEEHHLAAKQIYLERFPEEKPVEVLGVVK